MPVSAKLVGNVLTAPTLKNVSVSGDDRRICEFRVMASSYRQTDDGPEQIDKKTFPISITVWQDYLAKSVFDLIKVGMSVTVEGALFVSPYMDDHNAPQAGVRMEADSVAMNLRRIEQVILKARPNRDQSYRSNDTSEREPIDSPYPDERDSVPPDEAGTVPPILRNKPKTSRKQQQA